MLVAGDWAAGKERQEARPEDGDEDEDEGSDEMGDFEDVETGQVFGADGDAATAAAMKAIDAAAAEEAAEQQRAADKAAKKAAFDADFDTGMMLRGSELLVEGPKQLCIEAFKILGPLVQLCGPRSFVVSVPDELEIFLVQKMPVLLYMHSMCQIVTGVRSSGISHRRSGVALFSAQIGAARPLWDAA